MRARHPLPTAVPAADPADPADRRARIAAAYRTVCALELAALKPGNVHRHADGHGMTVADFLTSARQSSDPLTQPGLGLGERVYRAVSATRDSAGCNTNLGILLLCAPLIQAALGPPDPDLPAGAGTLSERLALVLAGADRADTDGLFRAIRLAAPGGLGHAARHDVQGPATGTPLEVMSHAAGRDRIALQYATGFADLFERAVPLLAGLEQRWQSPVWAAAGLYMDFLSRFPDTHVARKLGEETALALCRTAAPLTDALLGAPDPRQHRTGLLDLDRRLKSAGINPGTSADLTVACLLIRRLGPLCIIAPNRSARCADRHPGPDPGPSAAVPGRHDKHTET
jgi:triphosphoribosyl-dephospho-CoA synthase